MEDDREVDDEFSRKVAELVEMMKDLEPDRLEQLSRELEGEAENEKGSE